MEQAIGILEVGRSSIEITETMTGKIHLSGRTTATPTRGRWVGGAGKTSKRMITDTVEEDDVHGLGRGQGQGQNPGNINPDPGLERAKTIVVRAGGHRRSNLHKLSRKTGVMMKLRLPLPFLLMR